MAFAAPRDSGWNSMKKGDAPGVAA